MKQLPKIQVPKFVTDKEGHWRTKQSKWLHANFFSADGLKERGWTKSLIESQLGDPAGVCRGMYQPCRLWKREHVLKTEKNQIVKKTIRIQRGKVDDRRKQVREVIDGWKFKPVPKGLTTAELDKLGRSYYGKKHSPRLTANVLKNTCCAILQSKIRPSAKLSKLNTTLTAKLHFYADGYVAKKTRSMVLSVYPELKTSRPW